MSILKIKKSTKSNDSLSKKIRVPSDMAQCGVLIEKKLFNKFKSRLMLEDRKIKDVLSELIQNYVTGN